MSSELEPVVESLRKQLAMLQDKHARLSYDFDRTSQLCRNLERKCFDLEEKHKDLERKLYNLESRVKA